jgi:hypothetical protein
VARARITDEVGLPAVRATDRSRDQTATAVRYLLQLLVDRVPGNTVEVRVPPFGAVQVVEGPRHTRGTPPNVIEMDAETWIGIATGALSYGDARIHASGTRADISFALPLLRQ